MNAQPSLWDTPRARVTDPASSESAARAVRPANRELIEAIHAAIRAHGPMTQEQIGVCVGGSRWLVSTVVTACARADLVTVAYEHNSRGRMVGVYDLALAYCPRSTETVRVQGGRL